MTEYTSEDIMGQLVKIIQNQEIIKQQLAMIGSCLEEDVKIQSQILKQIKLTGGY